MSYLKLGSAAAPLLLATALATAVLAASPASATTLSGVVQPGEHLSFLMFPTSTGPFYRGSGLAETLTIWAERPFASGDVVQYFEQAFSEQSFDGAIWMGDDFSYSVASEFAHGDETVPRYVVPLYVPLSDFSPIRVCCAPTPPYERPGFFGTVVTALNFYLELDIPADSPPTRFWVRATVPEPSSWAELVAGFGLLGSALRRARVHEWRSAFLRIGVRPG